MSGVSAVVFPVLRDIVQSFKGGDHKFTVAAMTTPASQ